MDEHTEKIWLMLNAIVRQLSHLKYWTVAEEYHPDILNTYQRMRDLRDKLEGK